MTLVDTPAVVARDVRKVYRRFLHKNQFRHAQERDRQRQPARRT
jgi:hypothetical protein